MFGPIIYYWWIVVYNNDNGSNNNSKDTYDNDVNIYTENKNKWIKK